MLSQIGVGGYEVRLIASDLLDITAQVVREQGLAASIHEREGPYVQAEPVGELLALGGFGVGEVGPTQNGHNELGLADSPLRRSTTCAVCPM